MYSVTKSTIEAKTARFRSLAIAGVDDKVGRKAVREARSELVADRGAIERTRVALKADALEYGKKVDAVAKELTGLIAPEEERLKGLLAAVEEQEEAIRIAKDNEQFIERQKKMSETGRAYPESALRAMSDVEFDAALMAQAEIAKIRAMAAEIQAKSEADRVKREQEEIERKRVDAERMAAEELSKAEQRAKEQAESDRVRNEHEHKLALEKAAFLIQQEAFAKAIADQQAADYARAKLEQEASAAAQAKLDAERAEIEAERAKIDEQKRKQELKELAVLAAAEAKKEAIRKREDEAKAQLERERKAEEEKARAELLRPDREKLLSVADVIALIAVPHVSEEATLSAVKITEVLIECADRIRIIAENI